MVTALSSGSSPLPSAGLRRGDEGRAPGAGLRFPEPVEGLQEAQAPKARDDDTLPALSRDPVATDRPARMSRPGSLLDIRV